MTKRELYKLFDEVMRETERENRLFESLVYAAEQDTPEKEILSQPFTETDWVE